MAARQHAHSEHSAAIVVRFVAFVVATLGILAIPAILVATATGHVPLRAAGIAISIAVVMVAAAAVAVRPFDPLRR